MKILYFDTETTGLDSEKNGIIQMSGIIEIDGVVKETFNFKMAPCKTDIIDAKALQVTGSTVEKIQAYPEAKDVYKQIRSLFGKYVNEHDRNDRFFPAGYNVPFDINFLSSWFKKMGEPFFYTWCAYQGLDGLALVHYLRFLGEINLPNYKLSTVCAHYGININAHDALSDITATRELIFLIKSMLKVEHFNVQV